MTYLVEFYLRRGQFDPQQLEQLLARFLRKEMFRIRRLGRPWGSGAPAVLPATKWKPGAASRSGQQRAGQAGSEKRLAEVASWGVFSFTMFLTLIV